MATSVQCSQSKTRSQGVGEPVPNLRYRTAAHVTIPPPIEQSQHKEEACLSAGATDHLSEPVQRSKRGRELTETTEVTAAARLQREKVTTPLTEEQRAIINRVEQLDPRSPGNICIVAHPGTGKSYTASHIILNFLKKNPDLQVSVPTTTAAAGEVLEQRFKKVVSQFEHCMEQGLSNRALFKTFHGFTKKLITVNFEISTSKNIWKNFGDCLVGQGNTVNGLLAENLLRAGVMVNVPLADNEADFVTVHAKVRTFLLGLVYKSWEYFLCSADLEPKLLDGQIPLLGGFRRAIEQELSSRQSNGKTKYNTIIFQNAEKLADFIKIEIGRDELLKTSLANLLKHRWYLELKKLGDLRDFAEKENLSSAHRISLSHAIYQKIVFVVLKSQHVSKEKRICSDPFNEDSSENQHIYVKDFDKLITSPDTKDLGLCLVDEAQDLNPIQHELVKLLWPSRSLIMIGDKNQSIFGFLHAKPELLDMFQKEIEERSPEDVLYLTKSFRFGVNIAKVANFYLNLCKLQCGGREIVGGRPGGPDTIHSFKENICQTLDAIRDLSEKSVVQVVFRANSAAWNGALAALSDPRLSHRFDIRLKLSSSGTMVGKILLACRSFFRLSVKPNGDRDKIESQLFFDSKEVKTNLKSSDWKAFLELERRSISWNDLVEHCRKVRDSVEQVSKSLEIETTDSEPPEDFIRDLFEFTYDYTSAVLLIEKYRDQMSKGKLNDKWNLGFIQLMTEKITKLGGYNETDIETTRQSSKKNVVIVTNAHQAKGTEADVVIVQEGFSGCPDKQGEINAWKFDEKGVFYVALTRAKKQLFIPQSMYEYYIDSNNQWIR